MAGLLLRLRTWWEVADRTQKAVTLFGGGFLLLLLIGTFYFASRPKMEMAFGGLSSAEQGQVVAEIQKMGIAVDFDLSGNVLVPSSKVSEVRMRLASSGSLPSAAHWSNGDLEKINLMIGPRVERERLKVIAEGELARTIEELDSVESARVHITIGQDSSFADERREATASVMITESGDPMNGEQAKSIARLVANAVQGLSTKNITIVDQNLQAIWDGDSETGAQGRASERLQAEISEGRRREQQLQQKLDYFFGPGSTAVTVDLRLDFDTSSERTSTPVASEEDIRSASVKESMKNGSGPGGQGGPAGLSDNLGGGTGAPGEPPSGSNSTSGASDEGYVREQKENEKAYGTKETQTEKSPGEVKSMAISVLVDSKKVENVKPVQDFVNNYLGGRADDANFTAKVTAVERQPVLEQAAAKAAADSAGRERMQQIFSLLPIGALLLVAFLVLKGLTKAAKSQNVMVAALPGGRTMPMALAASNEPVGQVIHKELPSGEHALPGKSAMQQQMEEIEDLPEITARINKPLEQIKRMSGDRPEVVAMLIKSWLLEERR